MPVQKISIDTFLSLRHEVTVLDVRSPSEFAHAHVPGAFSLPLFTDDERKEIGTSYKQVSRESAIKIGLQAFGKNLVSLLEQAEGLLNTTKDPRRVIVHCWRGGMRSAAVAWLLDLYGFKVYVLEGGYKSFRKWALLQFEKKYKLQILGGCTGSNKTGIIHLANTQVPCIDLEGLALHKGSAFGNLEQHPQPSQEQFENSLASELAAFLESNDPRPLLLEGESQRIGAVNIPFAFFEQMRSAPLLFLEVPFEVRLGHIVEGYGKHQKEQLINAVVRIKKRLGGLEAKTCVNALLEDDVETCFRVLLLYYDKLYLKHTLGKEAEPRIITYVKSDTVNASENFIKLQHHAGLRS